MYIYIEFTREYTFVVRKNSKNPTIFKLSFVARNQFCYDDDHNNNPSSKLSRTLSPQQKFPSSTTNFRTKSLLTEIITRFEEEEEEEIRYWASYPPSIFDRKREKPREVY